jgi:hypothetical protein
MIAFIAIWIAIHVADRLLQRYIGRFELASTVNATVMTAAAVVQLVTGAEWHPTVAALKWFPVTYYITDLPMCNLTMRVHHMAAVVIFVLTPDQPLFVAVMMLCELPIPFLNIALWRESRGRRVGFPLAMTVLVSYALTRLIIFPAAIVWNFAFLACIHALLPAPYILVAVMSAWWFLRLVNRARNGPKKSA